MSRKYKITESQLSKIYERLTLSENVSDEEDTMKEETTEDDEDVKTESEKPWDKNGKKQAPETKKHMVGKMHEEKGDAGASGIGKPKFTGKSVNGGVVTKEWEKTSMPGKTPTDGIKSGGTSKNIEGTKANNGQWDAVKKTSPEASKHILKGIKGGDEGNSMGAKKPANKEWDKAKGSQAPEAKEHVKGSVKSQGGEKKIESAKAPEKNWEKAKAGTVNEKNNNSMTSMTPSQMRDKKKASMEEMANRMDKEAGMQKDKK